jgi:diguanylate cyclase (GGDEF)-like protein
MSWRAKRSQERWSHLLAVETEAIGRLEELVRAQNAFRVRFDPADPEVEHRYRAVAQLIDAPASGQVNAAALRIRIDAFRKTMAATRQEWNAASIENREQLLRDMDTASARVSAEAQRAIESRKREVARQMPELERDTRSLMRSGLAVAWIVVLLTFATAQITLRQVVKPIEDLSNAADQIAGGDLAASAPVGGDREIATLGMAFNRMTAELKARARTDELTSLPNFRAFREAMDAEIARASRYSERFGLLIIDLDKFKDYNDRFGHLAGNEALKRVALVVRDAVRQVDFPARYGGEEFAIILPQIAPGAMTMIAERIRARVEALPAAQDGGPITVSIGVALFPDDSKIPDILFSTADERLYSAKRAGRNRVGDGAASS